MLPIVVVEEIVELEVVNPLEIFKQQQIILEKESHLLISLLEDDAVLTQKREKELTVTKIEEQKSKELYTELYAAHEELKAQFKKMKDTRDLEKQLGM